MKTCELRLSSGEGLCAWRETMRFVAATVAVLAFMSCASSAEVKPQRQLLEPRRWNITCMLVFGDSTVDAGNNNRLHTTSKANFPPYGRDFFGRRPTGRFSDGRLATDLIADDLGISKTIPAFLDPNLRPEHLIQGASFASGSSGYDELTAADAGVLSFPKQIEYLMHYKVHLSSSVGAMKAEQTLNNAIFIVSAGTNDFIENYFLGSNRSTQFTVSEYEDYLIKCMSKYIKQMHRIGARNLALVGVPPMGCLPVIKTLNNVTDCLSTLNTVAQSFNSKLVAELLTLRKMLNMTVGYLDIFQVITDVGEDPLKYGFEETSKGCCGTGLIEFGETCKGLSTCKDPSKYMYWDAVHPTERLYSFIRDYAIKLLHEILG